LGFPRTLAGTRFPFYRPPANKVELYNFKRHDKRRRGLIRHLGEYLKEVGWALFLIYLFLGIIALLVGRYLEDETAAWVCLGLGVIVTLIIGSLIAGNLVWILFTDAIATAAPTAEVKKRGGQPLWVRRI
jgi:hypothetical protein